MCPLCGSKGYTSFNSFECSKPACPNYKPSNTPVSGGSPSQGPQWKHQCTSGLCRFITRDGLLDVYSHARPGDPLVSILVRFGDKEEDYCAFFGKHANTWPEMVEKARGMLPKGHPAKTVP
jgi:hypothetical protein